MFMYHSSLLLMAVWLSQIIFWHRHPIKVGLKQLNGLVIIVVAFNSLACLGTINDLSLLSREFFKLVVEKLHVESQISVVRLFPGIKLIMLAFRLLGDKADVVDNVWDFSRVGNSWTCKGHISIDIDCLPGSRTKNPSFKSSLSLECLRPHLKLDFIKS